jgi:pimeloyl-ACP methyl ester carboxylesterase
MPGGRQVIEKVALFGEAKNLGGVVTEPSAGNGPAANIGVLLLNAGVIHRIGPGRLNVKIARRLAAAGFTALRFDLAGLGDSRTSQSTLAYDAQAVADVRAAIDYLQSTRGLQQFVLGGLCSGADNSFATATVDSRVIGLILLDPYTYPTWQTRPRLQLLRLKNARWLADFLQRDVRRLLPTPTTRNNPAPTPPAATDEPAAGRYSRRQPPLADFAAGLASVLYRGGDVITFYSGSSLDQFSYPRQLDDALRPFGLAGRIDCRFWPRVNHTFTELSAQSELLDAVLAWTVALRARLVGGESAAGRVTAGAASSVREPRQPSDASRIARRGPGSDCE